MDIELCGSRTVVKEYTIKVVKVDGIEFTSEDLPALEALVDADGCARFVVLFNHDFARRALDAGLVYKTTGGSYGGTTKLVDNIDRLSYMLG